MTNQYREEELCEACGVSAEMGFTIKEGDEVAQVSLFSESWQDLSAEMDKYIELAKSVNPNVSIELSELTAETKEYHANLKFEVSAEKIIFDLKSRSLSR